MTIYYFSKKSKKKALKGKYINQLAKSSKKAIDHHDTAMLLAIKRGDTTGYLKEKKAKKLAKKQYKEAKDLRKGVKELKKKARVMQGLAAENEASAAKWKRIGAVAGAAALGLGGLAVMNKYNTDRAVAAASSSWGGRRALGRAGFAV